MMEDKDFGRTENRQARAGKPRVTFASHACYFDTYNEACVATRSLMERLAAWGFPAMAMTGTVAEAGKEFDPGSWLAEQGLIPEFFDAQASATSMAAPARTASVFYRLTVADVQVVLHRNPTSQPHALYASRAEIFHSPARKPELWNR